MTNTLIEYRASRPAICFEQMRRFKACIIYFYADLLPQRRSCRKGVKMVDTQSNLQPDAENAEGRWVEDQSSVRKIYYPNIDTGRETDRKLSAAFKIGLFLLMVAAAVWLFTSIRDANDGNSGYAAGIVTGVVILGLLRRKLIGWLSGL